MNNKKTGVQEWAQHSFNCVLGCKNNCRYCYAKRIKQSRFKLTRDWKEEQLINKYTSSQKHYNGIVMFPTAHDINEENYEHFVNHLCDLVGYKNNVLIVSKMDYNIANKFINSMGVDLPHSCKSQIEFRITMTCFKEDIKKYWELELPRLSSRYLSIMSLQQYFKTSISIEPLIDGNILPYIILNKTMLSIPSSDIWIGCLTNYKLNPNIPEEKAVIELYKTLPEIYEEYKNYDFIKFKDSFFKAMNRELKRRKRKPKFSFGSADYLKLNGRDFDKVILDEMKVKNEK